MFDTRYLQQQRSQEAMSLAESGNAITKFRVLFSGNSIKAFVQNMTDKKSAFIVDATYRIGTSRAEVYCHLDGAQEWGSMIVHEAPVTT